MKHAFTKGLAVGAMAVLSTVAVSQAHADTYVVNAGDRNGPLDAGQSTLDLGGVYLALLDTGKMAVSAVSPADLFAPKDQDGFYIDGKVTSPLRQVTMDADTHVISSISTQGGLTITAPTLFRISTGGNLTVTDLSVNLTSGAIQGTLTGAHGVGTLNDIAIWNIGEMKGTSVITAHNTCPNLPNGGCDYFGREGFDQVDVQVQMTGLTLTPQAKAAFNQGLGLVNLGPLALTGTDNDADITLTLNGHFDVPAGFHLGVVPEPGTSALMGLGLVGMGLLRARRFSAKA